MNLDFSFSFYTGEFKLTAETPTSLKFKMNGKFIIFVDAFFFLNKGKSAYGMIIYFDNFFVVAASALNEKKKKKRHFNAKEGEVYAILHTFEKS